jgi:hypothetical protein
MLTNVLSSARDRRVSGPASRTFTDEEMRPFELRLRSLSTEDLREQIAILRLYDEPVQSLAALRWPILVSIFVLVC